jgi:hypothetical protein
LVAGNIYTNSRNSKIPTNFTLHNKSAEDWLKSQGTQTTEYEFLIHVLSGLGKDIVVDLLKEANNGESLVTYGATERKVVKTTLKNGEVVEPKFNLRKTTRDISMKYLNYFPLEEQPPQNVELEWENNDSQEGQDHIEVIEEEKILPMETQLTIKEDQMSE